MEEKSGKIGDVIYGQPLNNYKGPFNNYVDKIRGKGVKKCLFLSILSKGIKTVDVGGVGVSKTAKFCHIVFE